MSGTSQWGGRNAMAAEAQSSATVCTNVVYNERIDRLNLSRYFKSKLSISASRSELLHVLPILRCATLGSSESRLPNG